MAREADTGEMENWGHFCIHLPHYGFQIPLPRGRRASRAGAASPIESGDDQTWFQILPLEHIICNSCVTLGDRLHLSSVSSSGKWGEQQRLPHRSAVSSNRGIAKEVPRTIRAQSQGSLFVTRETAAQR